MKLKPINNKRNWREEEINFLQENWGIKSVGCIAKKLNRSDNAVLIKAWKLKLGSFLESSDMISLNQMLEAIGYRNSNSYFIDKIKKAGFPIVYKKVRNNSFAMVRIEEFWEWAEHNHSLIDFSKFEENILGKEPEWAKQKRKSDSYKYNTSPWTKSEEAKLYYLMTEKDFNYKELSDELNRSPGAIQRKIIDMGWKYRPTKVDNHIKWTSTELDILINGIINYDTYKILQDKIGRSEKAIRGKVYVLCKTEVLSKARTKLIERRIHEQL